MAKRGLKSPARAEAHPKNLAPEKEIKYSSTSFLPGGSYCLPACCFHLLVSIDGSGRELFTRGCRTAICGCGSRSRSIDLPGCLFLYVLFERLHRAGGHTRVHRYFIHCDADDRPYPLERAIRIYCLAGTECGMKLRH